ncbi:MAG: UDP-3-O-(3-hydroxymyristoyl)glucosamine N-acyltransferase [Thermoguttaceae bacterium]|nr:UDP-3-O-(3-hydroxymyristoyl)glucosamine N-acyltransferase [Thermoguttaceae bacterium]MDW8038580.1 UDP-3-O-(3-hydroxymyristoyl)glucosamine N-acyltransferase [Thermoguttaceae bacterium]
MAVEAGGRATCLLELAELVGGRVESACGIDPGKLMISGAAPLAEAGPGQITLVDRPERAEAALQSGAAAAVAPEGLSSERLPLLVVADPHTAFAKIICYFRPPRQSVRRGIHPTAVIAPSARLAEDVEIGPYVTIGEEVEIGPGTTIHAGVRIMDGVKIGPEVTIFPNAVLYENTVVGPRCIIHAGAVIGAYGFGYVCQQGRYRLAAQLGNVVLGPEVEIGACTTIDRGTYGSTVIGEGTKIDNLVMIAHNCRIGRHNMICAQVGIAGSSTTGDHVIMAGQVGVKDHVQIGDGAVLGAMSGVIADVPPGARMVGIPATPEWEQRLKQVAWTKLPEMRQEFKRLQATVARLSEQLELLHQRLNQKPTDSDRAVA